MAAPTSSSISSTPAGAGMSASTGPFVLMATPQTTVTSFTPTATSSPTTGPSETSVSATGTTGSSGGPVATGTPIEGPTVNTTGITTPLSMGPSIDIGAAPSGGTAFSTTVNINGTPLQIQETTGAGGRLTADPHMNSLLVGNGPFNWLDAIGSASGTTKIMQGGHGENTMASSGGTTLYIHAAGATDDIANFRPDLGDKIASATGAHPVSAQEGLISDANLNETSPGLILAFADGSHVGLPFETGPMQSSWFV